MGRILEARYLNVDFLVEAAFDLSSVVKALREDVTLLWDESSEQSSSFGIESKLINTDTPQDDILELIRVLENLPSKQKQLLRDSHKKVFDIAFECGTLGKPIDAELSLVSVQRIAELGCHINIKLYPLVEHPYED